MDIEHIRPFIYQTISTFEMLLGVRPIEQDVETKDRPYATYDVSAIIGITGSGTGGVVLSFPEDVACKVVGRMLDEHIAEVDQDVVDGVGELVNIITGNAKRDLVKHGFDDLTVSIPNVVIGRHRMVWHSKDMPCLMSQFFLTELGPFSIEVNIRRNRQS